MIRSTAGWVCFVALSIGLASYGQMQDWEPGAVLFVQGATAFIFCFVIEAAIPYRQDWRWHRDHNVFTDLGHTLLFDQSVQFLVPVVTIVVFTYFRPMNADSAVEPAAIILGVVYLEVSEYWRHRLLHSSDRFWPIHALHHHLDRMHIFRSGRVHFLDGIARVLMTFLPALLLGVPVEAIIWWMILLNATGPISHSNVNIITPGWVNGLLTTPMVHRVHHASHDDLMRHNLAPIFPLVDRLFGTWRAPEDYPVTMVGVDPDPVPQNFLRQLAYPFPPLVRMRSLKRAVRPDPF